MAAAEYVVAGRVRIRSWRGRPDVAELASVPPGAAVSPRAVGQAMAKAAEAGYAEAVTPALGPAELRPYLDAGFEKLERLHLLVHDLHELPPRGTTRLRRATSRDQDAVLEVDNAAFDGFWRMDADALHDAVAATPAHRYRVDAANPLAGYAIYGRAAGRGYLQRLAVHPDAEGQGLGTALVADGLHWLRRWRSHEALVNTQEANQRALGLYQHLGFRRRDEGLFVLRAELR